MIDQPRVVVEQDFQNAWKSAANIIFDTGGDIRNLVVQIVDPSILDDNFQRKMFRFADEQKIKDPKKVAYTIFPHNLYESVQNGEELFLAYNRKGGMYSRLHRRHPDWGTYFKRMTGYIKEGKVINQLKNIIDAINDRGSVSRGCYTIVIQNPGGETIRPRGGPCLNYLAVQLENTTGRTLGLLAVYRSHDFFERSYGNYWGLCNLQKFLAVETNSELGPLTCISSRAFIAGSKRAFQNLLRVI